MMSANDMSALMDGLVNEARASRDSTFNALDAVERESLRNSQRLAGQVDRYVQVHETSLAQILRLEVPRLLAEQAEPGREPSTGAPERDTRFDPEDQWELDSAAASPSSAAPAPRRAQDSDDDDGYPDTWLR
jgi:hypothetical protein